MAGVEAFDSEMGACANLILKDLCAPAGVGDAEGRTRLALANLCLFGPCLGEDGHAGDRQPNRLLHAHAPRNCILGRRQNCI
jgi:hypothetical protein